MKKDVLKKFTKSTRNHLCQSLFFNKAQGPRPATLLKKRLRHRCLPVNFVKFSKAPFLQNTSGWLLLVIWKKKSVVQIMKISLRRINPVNLIGMDSYTTVLHNVLKLFRKTFLQNTCGLMVLENRNWSLIVEKFKNVTISPFHCIK